MFEEEEMRRCEYCGARLGVGVPEKQRFCSQMCYRWWRAENPIGAYDHGHGPWGGWTDEPLLRSRRKGPTPDIRVLRKDAFGELDGEKWAEEQAADIERRMRS